MANCPVCGHVMEDDFGLVNCPSCGSPVLLGMDGEISVPDTAAPEVAEPEPLETFEEEIIEEPPAMEESIQEFAEPASEPPPVDEYVEEYLEELPEAPPEAPPANPADMSDVVEFGNSEVSNASEGNLKFNLKISGIDTVDVKTGIKDVLSDAKLHLDAEQTISQVESGELFLEGLSAVKCAILVQRLKSLSLDINWEQYAIQQA